MLLLSRSFLLKLCFFIGGSVFKIVDGFPFPLHRSIVSKGEKLQLKAPNGHNSDSIDQLKTDSDVEVFFSSFAIFFLSECRACLSCILIWTLRRAHFGTD